MRVGVLYDDERIEERGSVFDSMYSFINGRRYAREFGSHYAKPLYLVQLNENGRWGKLQPTPQQVKDCLQAVTTWIAYNQQEMNYRA